MYLFLLLLFHNNKCETECKARSEKSFLIERRNQGILGGNHHDDG